MADFVGLGYCSRDELCRLPEIPLDHKVEMLEYRTQGGGPAATATVAAARLGVACAFVGGVGQDDAGRAMLEELASEGIDVSAVRVRAAGGSPISQCWIDPQGRRSVAWTANRLEWLRADEIPAEAIARARLLHLDGHHPEAALAAARHARAHGVTVSYDAGSVRPISAELVGLSDVLIASEHFARAFTGENDPERALRELRAAAPLASVVGFTLGPEGSLFWRPDRMVRVPAFSGMPVVDTTGAGDAFHGAFAAYFLEGRDPFDCARFASAAAAVKCGLLGARAGLPDRAAVEAFLRRQKDASP